MQLMFQFICMFSFNLIFNKTVYSVLKQLQYISFLATNHLQANVNHMEVHSVCTHMRCASSSSSFCRAPGS